MPYLSTDMPYLIPVRRTSRFPYTGKTGKMGYGNLIIPYKEDFVSLMNYLKKPINPIHDNKYYFLNYNTRYFGKIGIKPHKIIDLDGRNQRMDILSHSRLNLKMAPLKYPNGGLEARNTILDMTKYIEIFKSSVSKLPMLRVIRLFWDYFIPIWTNPYDGAFKYRAVVIQAEDFPNLTYNYTRASLSPVFMIYYAIYKEMENVAKLDLDFYIVNKSGFVLRINPSKVTKKNISKIKLSISKIYNRSVMPEMNEVEAEINKEMAVDVVKSTSLNFTGNTVSSNAVDNKPITNAKPERKREIDKKSETKTAEVEAIKDIYVKKHIDRAVDDVKVIRGEKNPSEKTIKIAAEIAKEEVKKDEDLADALYTAVQKEVVPKKPVSSKRDAIMREKQKKLKVRGINLNYLNEEVFSKKVVPDRNVSNKIGNINKNVNTVRYPNIQKTYVREIMGNDIMKVFTNLNNTSTKFYVIDTKIEDTSDELNYKETYRVVLGDENGVRHHVTVDIPKFLEDKFLYIGGNRKTIGKHAFFYPVVKTAPNAVQIVTNYKKIFIYRTSTGQISAVSRLLSAIKADESLLKYFTIGDNSEENAGVATTIEYDEFSRVFTKFESGGVRLFFNYKDACEIAGIDENNQKELFLGFDGESPIMIDLDTQVDRDGRSIAEIIDDALPTEVSNKIGKIRGGKKLMFNTATIMKQKIPLIVLLIFWEGISTVFKKMNLEYTFTDKRSPKVSGNEGLIRFADGCVIYKNDVPTQLLLNGLNVIDTNSMNFSDLDTKESLSPYLKKVYGKLSIISALENFYEFMIDPITLEVLGDIDLPKDIVSLAIYANNLLADENYTPETSPRLYRIRSEEVIPGMLHAAISKAFIAYKNSGGKTKLSVPRNEIIKNLLKLETVEDYSTLNPTHEVTKDRTLSLKGYVGINEERAFTYEKRLYEKDNMGIVALSSPADKNVGVIKYLTLEPTIANARGYLDYKSDKPDELKDVNLFSPGELLFPLGVTRDEPLRTAMAHKQTNHLVPTKVSSPAIITNGVDESIKYYLSSDFVVNADEDGKVIDYDETTGIMMLEYKSGKHRAVDLSPNVDKNGGGGFYVCNQLVTDLKVGDKFKENDNIAYHKNFFSKDQQGTRANVGVLSKVAVMSSQNTYNDSTYINNRLADRATTKIVFCKQVVLGKNANVYNVVKEGAEISVGDILMSFDSSFEDEELNKLLSSLSDEGRTVLEEGSTNNIRSKFTGKILKINMYSTVDADDLSPSLKKLINSKYSAVNRKKKFVNSYANPTDDKIVRCGLLMNETTGKVEPNMYGILKGQKIDEGVLIEFFIEYDDTMGVADKLVFFTALKVTVNDVIPEGYEAYSEYRPEEYIDCVLGPSAITNRKVPSINLTLFANKVEVELKRKLEEIYNK